MEDEIEPVFLTFAAWVAVEAGSRVRDEDVEALARLLQVTMTKYQERVVREALIESAKHPHSVIAKITRRRINKLLPPFLKGSGIEPIIIRLGAIAAQVPELWDLVIPHRTPDVRVDQENSGSAQRHLPEVRKPDEASGDDDAPVSER